MNFNYSEYAALFNKGNDQALVDRYFDNDIIFSGTGQETKGHVALMKFLIWVPY
jgi:hypothetical protein